MNYGLNFILGVGIVALAVGPGFGQVKDWIDVTRQELEMQVYPSDSSATAVVLFDRAHVDLNNLLEYVMERHVRIKILKKEGFEWADVKLSFNEEMDQDIFRIKGHTFNLNAEGEIEKSKLDKRSIFKETVA